MIDNQLQISSCHYCDFNKIWWTRFNFTFKNTAMSLSNGLKNAGKYKDLVILLDESTSIKVIIFQFSKKFQDDFRKTKK